MYPLSFLQTPSSQYTQISPFNLYYLFFEHLLLWLFTTYLLHLFSPLLQKDGTASSSLCQEPKYTLILFLTVQIILFTLNFFLPLHPLYLVWNLFSRYNGTGGGWGEVSQKNQADKTKLRFQAGGRMYQFCISWIFLLLLVGLGDCGAQLHRRRA